MRNRNEKCFSDAGKIRPAGVFTVFCVCVLITGCTKKTEEYREWVPYEEETRAESQDSPAETKEEEPELKEEVPCFVHIGGAVKNPGVYQLPGDSRIFQAIEKAGGFTEDADQNYVNLAERIQDGSKIMIPTADETEKSGTAGEKQEYGVLFRDSGETSLVNLNTADREKLCTLPGVGDSRADAILSYRKEHGEFTSIDEIMQIAGIKESLFEKIKDKICVR